MKRLCLFATAMAVLWSASVNAEVIIRKVEDKESYVPNTRPEWMPAPTKSLRDHLPVSPDKRDDIDDLLFLPYFFIDPAAGDTTLFAARNVSADVVPLAIQYFTFDIGDGAIRTDTINAEPNQVVTVNIRDVADLVPSGDGTFNGFLRVANTGQTTQTIVGDFFQVDLLNNFATGDRLLALNDLCEVAEIRFLSGGAFDGGTEFRVLVDTPQGSNPDTDPPTAIISTFDEAGNASDTFEVFTDANAIRLTAADITTTAFGVAEFDFNLTNGTVMGTYSASGKFSVGMNAVCKPRS